MTKGDKVRIKIKQRAIKFQEKAEEEQRRKLPKGRQRKGKEIGRWRLRIEQLRRARNGEKGKRKGQRNPKTNVI